MLKQIRKCAVNKNYLLPLPCAYARDSNRAQTIQQGEKARRKKIQTKHTHNNNNNDDDENNHDTV